MVCNLRLVDFDPFLFQESLPVSVPQQTSRAIELDLGSGEERGSQRERERILTYMSRVKISKTPLHSDRARGQERRMAMVNYKTHEVQQKSE